MFDNLGSSFSEGVLGFIISFVLGILVSQGWNQFVRFPYRNWVVSLRYKNKEIVTRRISPQKMNEIMGEPYEKAVYVKGVISPYGLLRCDPLETEGLITINENDKLLVINLDKDKNFKPYDVLADNINESSGL